VKAVSRFCCSYSGHSQREESWFMS
jgi:hypothetical protein